MRLADLRADFALKRQLWLDLIPAKFPGRESWDWLRACAAARGENVRRNDDTSQDAAMAEDSDIRAAHDAYISAVHAFYRARDGEGGFLGGMRSEHG